MTVLSAKVMGYCMGVRRAVDAALKALEENENVYSLGPLIHNQTVLDLLSSKGLGIIEESQIDSLKENSTVIIRAHGVPPKVLDALKNRNCNVIDATCPRVVASQRNVQKYSELGYTVILAGDKNHGEVIGIAGYAGKDFYLVQNSDEAKSLADNFDGKSKAFLLSQTTFSPVEFECIGKEFQHKFSEFKVMNTICSATKERQDALVELCPSVDGVLVVGGKNSANTRRLYQIACKYCSKVLLIENAAQITDDFLALERIGITAGASTPDVVIDGVKTRLFGK